VNGTGLSCYFAMPFEKGARIEIENQTNRNIDTQGKEEWSHFMG
jgi:hypothetical protein